MEKTHFLKNINIILNQTVQILIKVLDTKNDPFFHSQIRQTDKLTMT